MKSSCLVPLVFAALWFAAGRPLAAAPLKALIVDGQNNHDWRSTTPHLKRILEQTGLFVVDVATTAPGGGDLSSFRPAFKNYRVVISNYNGDSWPAETRAALVRFVAGGGGFVSVHAANNAFPDWPEYNEMIGVGGWGGRTEQAGPWLYWESRVVRDTSPGPGGRHGIQHPFKVVVRAPNHPVMDGLPSEWWHAKDELYDRLRGPAKNVTVLATAFSDPATKGTGKHEPMLLALSYGNGRVFHTTLGHNNGPDLTSQRCVGFIVTLQRGAEWAATGRVTQPVPADFPGREQPSLRP
jgi:type 1 glutamine amidotransferase